MDYFNECNWRTIFLLVHLKKIISLFFAPNADNLLSLKRFSKQKIKKLGKEAQVLKEKNLIKDTSSYACVPRVICTCADQTHAGILLDTCLACSVASVLHSPFDESCARFCAASVVNALEDLHKV